MTWQLGILSDRAGHVHLGAIVATSDDHGCEFVELLAPVGACRPDELDVARVTVIRGEQLAELGRLAERCIDDAPLRDRLVELTRRSLMRTGDSRLASLEQATRLLQHARNVDEVRSIINKAEAARVYAQQARLGLEAQNYAAEVKLRAERRAGELLAEMELRDGGHAKRARSQPATELAAPPRLSDLGITRSQSSRWQAIARVPRTSSSRRSARPERVARRSPQRPWSSSRRARRGARASICSHRPRPGRATASPWSM